MLNLWSLENFWSIKEVAEDRSAVKSPVHHLRTPGEATAFAYDTSSPVLN